MSSWPISKVLLLEILADHITDSFVTQLVWERLEYKANGLSDGTWLAGENTPCDWSKAFPVAPRIIAERKASVHLTRSISKKNKQLLKQRLDFTGYRIDELYPRRTRRATAVNWLLAWLEDSNEELLEVGPLPELLPAPSDPLRGHPGDLPIN